jgi:hypothetical protein
MSHDRKKQFRELKRELKRRGNHRRRQQLKRDLDKNPLNPEIVSYDDHDRFRSSDLNGIDRDSTRRKREKHADKPNLEEDNDLETPANP